MHPVLQSVRNGSGGAHHAASGGDPHRQRRATMTAGPSAVQHQQQQQYQQHQTHVPPSPPRYPAQHALPVDPPPLRGPSAEDAYDPLEAPACGLASGAGLDQSRMRERELGRGARVPESNLFKARADEVPENDYEREAMYRAGQSLEVDRRRVLTSEDFVGPSAADPTFTPAAVHLRAAEMKRSAEQTAFNEELRNRCHQTRLRTALLRPELGAGIYYLYDFVQTYVEHPDGRVKLNPQLMLVAQHAGNTVLATRLWSIAEDRNAWLRDLIEMAYMIVNDPYLSSEQQLAALCTTVVELSMKYAKLAAKNGYPSMAQMAKAQEFFYRVMEAILDLGVQVGVYNTRPVRFRQKRMSELPQLTDADYMFGLTQALESRPPAGDAQWSDYSDQEGSGGEDSDGGDFFFEEGPQ
nr:encapsidation protein 52K [Tawny frogmouth aviadenovirus A]